MDSALSVHAITANQPARYQVYTENKLDKIEPLRRFSEAQRFAMRVVAKVLPFRVNEYVIRQLIDWDDPLSDPMFRLTFPQPDMLLPEHFDAIAQLLEVGADQATLNAAVHRIHLALNPHPADQTTLNIPWLDGERLFGLQHKYRETVLFFPRQSQTCHAYCTFCFRWPQFVGKKDLRIAAQDRLQLQHYLRAHREVTDLLVTGGDPLVMKTAHLATYLRPLLSGEFEHIRNIRIGSKALTYWPYRFVTDPDADDLLRLLEEIVQAGRNVAFMAHYNHWRELEPAIAREAVRRVRNTGAVIRTQSPVLRHINDDPQIWARLWRTQVHLGMVPYYMFVERDTGAKYYFELPLVRTWKIYRGAMQRVSGLGRTARGPSMSAGPGKVEIQGVADIHGERVLVLRFIQGRNPDWVERPFFAKYDPQATWLDQLVPAFGERRFFFQDEYDALRRRSPVIR